MANIEIQVAAQEIRGGANAGRRIEPSLRIEETREDKEDQVKKER
jgi:hypothetical protein